MDAEQRAKEHAIKVPGHRVAKTPLGWYCIDCVAGEHPCLLKPHGHGDWIFQRYQLSKDHESFKKEYFNEFLPEEPKK